MEQIFFPSRQFKNYIVGIIGFGRIGKKISIYLRNLNFKVIFYDNKKHLKADCRQGLRDIRHEVYNKF